jgi:hypothetical protein
MKERFIHAIRGEGGEDLKVIQGLVDTETWERIQALQKDKHSFVDALKQWRSKSLTGENSEASDRGREQNKLFEQGKDARVLRMVGEGTYEMYIKGGEVIPLTEGEVFAASEWGTWWQFDPSVPREVQSKVMRNQVHAVLADQFDQQLMAFGRADRLSDDRKRDAYADKQESEKSLEAMSEGHLAEKMLMSLLTKEMHDHADNLPFTVKSVDVYEDVEHKIDFVITVEGTRRGVKVNKPSQRIGIQFTMNRDATERKNQQLDRMRKHLDETDVDQLFLITMPLHDIKYNYDRWLDAAYSVEEKRVIKKRLDPRGPDHLWSPEIKKKIIDGLVRGIGLE